MYGLMYVALVKMKRPQSASSIMKGMLALFLYGLLFENISNAAHVGGFVGGLVMGVLCTPSYQKNYSMRRKWSLKILSF